MSNEFSAWLSWQIENRMMTRKAFAAACGLSRSMIIDLAAGTYRSRPSGLTIARIAHGLGLSREEVESHLDSEPASRAG